MLDCLVIITLVTPSTRGLGVRRVGRRQILRFSEGGEGYGCAVVVGIFDPLARMLEFELISCAGSRRRRNFRPLGAYVRILIDFMLGVAPSSEFSTPTLRGSEGSSSEFLTPPLYISKIWSSSVYI